METEIPERVGPYRLLSLLGHGGMATVYLAEHESGGPHVALKLLKREKAQDAQLVARFIREAEILEQLRIPGVVQVKDSGRHAGTAYLVMERLQGQTLREWMDLRMGRISLSEARLLGERIAAILAQVHARGITHRDLKPENIFLCSREEDDLAARVTLLDFGIAKQPTPAEVEAHDPTQIHTHESALLGTYPYMAPEQFRSAASAKESPDIYSLGVLLFEMLAGRRPFVSDDFVELMSAHVSRPPPSLRALVPSLHGSLCAFITSMLAKEPGRRPSMERCHDMLGRRWEETPETCPLPGLAPFGEAQAELFFGRDGELRALLALLQEMLEGSRRWVQVEGPAGVGKSSLLQAGLWPRLSRQSGWHLVCWRPGEELLETLARALASGPLRLEAGETAETVVRALRSGPGALGELAAARLPGGERLLLVLDPLEELFTSGPARCSEVAALLSAALEAPDSPVRLLTGVRTDFLHRLEQVPELASPLRRAARYTLAPMGSDALVQVVEGMSRQTGLPLSEGLAAQMARDAREETGGLSLLGNALRLLWGLSGGAALTHEQYHDRLGGLGGALARQAEALLEGLGAQGLERARWMLLSLVQVNRGAPDTRRPRSRRDVLSMAGDDALAEQVLLRLSGASSAGSGELTGLRLLQLSGGVDAREQRVELMHELLLLRVRSLAGWIERERPRLELRTVLEGAARDWHRAECPADDLPTGSLLAYYRGGAVAALEAGEGQRREAPEVVRYLQAARHLERRRSWTRRLLAASGVLAVLLILFYALLARHERDQAEASLQQFIARMNGFTGTSDWKLSWLPYTTDIRREMLVGFRESLEALTAQQRELPEVRRAAVWIFLRSSDFAFVDGSLAEARQFLDRAEVELRLALAQGPEDEELMQLRALYSSKQGKVERDRGYLEQACAHFERSVDEARRLQATGQDVKENQRILAVSDSELAECRMLQGQWDAAISPLDESIRLHKLRASDSYSKALLAQAVALRGRLAHAMNSPDAARWLKGAVDLGCESVNSAGEGDQYSRWALSQALLADADLQFTQGRRREAERENQEAREVAEQLLSGEPLAKRYALDLLEALENELRFSVGSGSPASRALRCALARDFHHQDEQDPRFQLTGCPDAPFQKEERHEPSGSHLSICRGAPATGP